MIVIDDSGSEDEIISIRSSSSEYEGDRNHAIEIDSSSTSEESKSINHSIRASSAAHSQRVIAATHQPVSDESPQERNGESQKIRRRDASQENRAENSDSESSNSSSLPASPASEMSRVDSSSTLDSNSDEEEKRNRIFHLIVDELTPLRVAQRRRHRRCVSWFAPGLVRPEAPRACSRIRLVTTASTFTLTMVSRGTNGGPVSRPVARS